MFSLLPIGSGRTHQVEQPAPSQPRVKAALPSGKLYVPGMASRAMAQAHTLLQVQAARGGLRLEGKVSLLTCHQQLL